MIQKLAAQIVSSLSWIDAVVIYVWAVLSVLMFIALGIVVHTKGFAKEALLIMLMVAATWSYPLYTFGYQLIPGLIGNVVYIAFVVWIVSSVYSISPVAAYLLALPVAWVSVATIYVAAQLLQ
jgi:tryptophan-rich sensory protein